MDNEQVGMFHCETKEGMTLREWYAGLAMQGYCSNPAFELWSYGDVAKSAYQQAMILIAELEKHGQAE